MGTGASEVDAEGDLRAPRLSVLTPSYNYARYLGAALDSVLANSGDIEHIVVDGGSTDGTLDLLRSRNGIRWVSEPDLGQSDALNKALALAGGEYVGWLNADDFYLPGALDRAIEYLDAHPDVDVVHGDVAFVDERGTVERVLRGYAYPAPVLRWRGCVIPSTATFMRRSVLGDAPFDVDLRIVMDWDLFLRLQRQGATFAYRPGIVAAFRRHEEQATHERPDRYSWEHDRVRRRWDAAPRASRFAVPMGDYYHRVAKLLSGSWRREQRARDLLGLSLLDSQGRIDPDACLTLSGRS